jgi:hypothetical protein
MRADYLVRGDGAMTQHPSQQHAHGVRIVNRLASARHCPDFWYRIWYRSHRIQAHLTVRERRRNAAPVLRWTLFGRPSKPVRSCNPRLGRFDSGAAPLTCSHQRRRRLRFIVRGNGSIGPYCDTAKWVRITATGETRYDQVTPGDCSDKSAVQT